MLNKTLSSLPDGKLVCCHDKHHCKWYQSDGHTKTYIPKANRELAEQLAVKKYLSYKFEELSQESLALESYLKHHHSNPNKSEQLLQNLSGYTDLLSTHFELKSQELSDWMNAPYETNPFHPEGLVHTTISGQYVRSKSEAMIAMCLHTHKIPFRYECALELGNSIVYPDFTIHHPHTDEIIYWEHFGRMDDPSYSKNVPLKLQTYISNGIIPSLQLITTYETQQHPLTMERIEKIIEDYFL